MKLSSLWPFRGAPLALSRGRWVGLAFVFVWFAVGGVAHFALTETEMRIVPLALIAWSCGVFERRPRCW